jgi:hypothetical protein
MRCPVCFSREVDVLLIPEDDGHYCVKCGFRGSEDRIRGLYADIKKKYAWMTRRLPLEEQLKL